jgi:hypothetical protein
MKIATDKHRPSQTKNIFATDFHRCTQIFFTCDCLCQFVADNKSVKISVNLWLKN